MTGIAEASMLSSTSTGLLLNAVSGAWSVPAAQQMIYGMTTKTATPDPAALSNFSITSSLLNLSATDESGQSMFDVVGAYYGMSAGITKLLGAYGTAAPTL
jgi:succinate-acetate transporter protein